CFFCDVADVRMRRSSVFIASLLIDQKFENLEEILNKIQSCLFFISLKQETDQFFYHHALNCLKLLQQNSLLKKKILQFSVPILNPWTERIVRNGIQLPSKEKI